MQKLRVLNPALVAATTGRKLARCPARAIKIAMSRNCHERSMGRAAFV
jgi:hypothetical protein